LIKTNRKIILDSGEINRICFLHLWPSFAPS
jgi:hypothetical protein